MNSVEEKKIVCSGENRGIVFNWTEDKIGLFGRYYQHCSTTGWCSCIDCFKRRYIDAEKKINKDQFNDYYSYSKTMLATMQY